MWAIRPAGDAGNAPADVGFARSPVSHITRGHAHPSPRHGGVRAGQMGLNDPRNVMDYTEVLPKFACLKADLLKTCLLVTGACSRGGANSVEKE
jgi:hypothetical protein